MKKLVALVFLVFVFMFSNSSCLVVNTKHDNGLHKGWYKAKNNNGHKAKVHPGNNKKHDAKEKKGKKKGKKK